MKQDLRFKVSVLRCVTETSNTEQRDNHKYYFYFDGFGMSQPDIETKPLPQSESLPITTFSIPGDRISNFNYMY